MIQPADIASAAEFFRVCQRTVRRWLAQGIDITDAAEVAAHLASQHHAQPEALDATLAALETELAELSTDES